MVDSINVQPPTSNNDFQAALDAAKLRLQRAFEGNDSEEQKNAIENLSHIIIEQATSGNYSISADQMQKLTIELAKFYESAMASLKKDAAGKELALNQERAQAIQKLLSKESGDLFDIKKMGSSATISLLGTFKGLAALFQAFGIDTTEFIKNCDNLIAAEEAKLPKMNINNMADKRTTDLSTEHAETHLETGKDKQFQEMEKRTEELLETIREIAKPTRTGTKQSPQEQLADLETAALIERLTKDPANFYGENMIDMVKRYSGRDGNPNNLSEAEQKKMVDDMTDLAINKGGLSEKSARVEAEKSMKALKILVSNDVEDTLAPGEKKVVVVQTNNTNQPQTRELNHN